MKGKTIAVCLLCSVLISGGSFALTGCKNADNTISELVISDPTEQDKHALDNTRWQFTGYEQYGSDVLPVLASEGQSLYYEFKNGHVLYTRETTASDGQTLEETFSEYNTYYVVDDNITIYNEENPEKDAQYGELDGDEIVLKIENGTATVLMKKMQ